MTVTSRVTSSKCVAVCCVRVRKPVRPLGWGAVAGEQDRASLVTFVDHIVHVLGGRMLDRLETEVVDDQQVGASVERETLLVSVVSATGMEMAQHLVGVGEGDVTAPATGFVGQRLSQMTFSNSRWAADQHVALVGEVMPGGQFVNQLAIETGVESEVERLQSLAGVEGGATQAHRQLFLSAPFDFVFQETLQEVAVSPLLGDGLLGADFERVEDSRQPQGLELGDEMLFQFHATPPRSERLNSYGSRAKIHVSSVTGAGSGMGIVSKPSCKIRLRVQKAASP